ncbi:MAG: hypothetical protein A2V77_00235 [Anaeromyxobacter sp. RBG_16_69_14]|nr:MAG: hypothetical protein A2V77_00235 [Anaeromyxobacter sp. RBG_16_69_14]
MWILSTHRRREHTRSVRIGSQQFASQAWSHPSSAPHSLPAQAGVQAGGGGGQVEEAARHGREQPWLTHAGQQALPPLST